MRCPVCKAAVEQGPQCRRCKAELSLLFAMEDQRHRLLAEASRLLAQDHIPEALTTSAQADALRSDADSWRLLALSHLLRRDFAAAWRYYQLQERAEPSS
jgi:methylphosphotriester-DNA--protein-cysteine methyltransferase